LSFGFAPKGWALCDGQLLPINQNQALFSLLGTTYGGDGRVDGRRRLCEEASLPCGCILGHERDRDVDCSAHARRERLDDGAARRVAGGRDVRRTVDEAREMLLDAAREMIASYRDQGREPPIGGGHVTIDLAAA
jgi:hypothetical protein